MALILALVVLGLTTRRHRPAIDYEGAASLQIGLAEVLAGETARAVSAHGNVVLVTDYGHTQRGPLKINCWEAFHGQLKQYAEIHILATEIVAPDPQDMTRSPGISPAALVAVLDRHAAADAFVFFVDLPHWRNVEKLLPQPLKTKLVALDCHGQEPGGSPRFYYSGYFTSGLLSALIFPLGKAGGPALPRTPHERFERSYSVYTLENYESLPGEGAKLD